MTHLIMPAAVALAAAVPGGHSANPPTPAHAQAYEKAYEQVAHELGRRAPGRNIVKYGFEPGQPATDPEVVASTGVLERMLAPAPAVPATHGMSATPGSSSTATTSSASTTSASGGAGGVPSCASESGSNYSTGASNTNSSSGATGRYQITPSTAANYGCNLSTPGGQDACAQTIYEHQGASAWVGCGG